MKETIVMIFGVDTHKRSHTVVAVDAVGKKRATKTVSTTTAAHLGLLCWAREQSPNDRLWAIEDCRQLSRRLERDLLFAGERIVRVPPKLMAKARDSARTYGKSDPIDALAVARAALREPDLPVGRLDGPERELRLLIDHRENLLQERTRAINRLRWHLHELDPSIDPKPRSLDRQRGFDAVDRALAAHADGVVARLARSLLERCRQLTTEIDALEKEITVTVTKIAPALLAIIGCGAITAAKIIGETANIERFKSDAAYARHNGTAPLPVWSANHSHHRVSRMGNRQLNTAIHTIAIVQVRCHPGAKALFQRRKEQGNGGLEALRVVKRRISDAVYQALKQDHYQQLQQAA